ncbi:uncharacterized protein LOC124449537 isoform X2 [Xenia sp. Carnegie-2017]|uniref:uncharacterized protein LOC124449537 isoform X2 n=1 Tax=Xenia sp. Carnegie-2017 TaxID=2897299 RepID=UPI001F045525|nr:uncharacterized protein LOC124449537 isoform X2 [Xenia sp. Carnegie-2017]
MDDSRTIVVLNPPSGVSEDEFTIHFQKKKNGGGDVDEVKVEKGVAFVIFDSLEDAVKVLNHPEKQIIKGCELDVRSYSSWLKTTQESENSASCNNDDVDSVSTEDDKQKATIYVSGLKESCTEELITLLFENEKKCGGGYLRDGKEGFERLSPTVARLTYVSPKDAENVLKRAKEKLLVLNGCSVQVTADYIPTEDRSILMVTNLSPDTNVETLKNFVEIKKQTDVIKIVLGKHGKAVIILQEEIKGDSKEENNSKNLKLGERLVSLKFAPLSTGISVKKIPKNAKSEDVEYKFSNPKTGGGEVINMEFDKNNGIAKLFFKSSSVVSNLVKKDHDIMETRLTVIPMYEDFEELDEPENKITEFHGDIPCESDVVDYIRRHHNMSQFDLKSVTYDETMSTFHFTKDVEGPKDGEDLSKRLKVYVNSFGKETLVIPTIVFDQVKLKVLENKVDSEIEIRFEKPNVVLFGLKEKITMKKKDIEKLVDELTSAARTESVKITAEDDEDKPTIYVSGFKESCTKDSITLFFENKRRCGGGELREGKKGFTRLSPTVARLTYVSSEDAENVLKKAKETPLVHEGSPLQVTADYVPTEDRSILMVTNLSPDISMETLKDFVESKKNTDVLKIFLGKHGKAVVILEEEMKDKDDYKEKNSSKNLTLGGRLVSFKFAPLTKGIKVKKIPKNANSEDVKYKFSNRKTGGDEVTNMEFDQNNGIAKIFLISSSAVSNLVKKDHVIKDTSLTVLPLYEDFEELDKPENKITEFHGDIYGDSDVINHVLLHDNLLQFDLKSMKYDETKSTVHFTKDVEDPKDGEHLTTRLKIFVDSFGKETLTIPTFVYDQVKQDVLENRNESEIEVKFENSGIVLIGRKIDVKTKKKDIQKLVDKLTAAAKKDSLDIEIKDKEKFHFFIAIGYFKDLLIEFPGVEIPGIEGSTGGKLTVLGTAESVKNMKLRVFEDLDKIHVIKIEMSDRQIDFLKRTECKIANEVLKKDKIMLILKEVEGHVGAKGFQPQLMFLKEPGNVEEERVVEIIKSKTSEKLVKIDEETGKFLAKSDHLLTFTKDQLNKNKVLICTELANPDNIWIICEESKMKDAEQDLRNLIAEKKIEDGVFKPVISAKVRFLQEHRWDKIMSKMQELKNEGVDVEKTADENSLRVKGTPKGKKKMIEYLDKKAGGINSKTFPLSKPGMKKQMSLDATNAIISGIEKNHNCVIEKIMAHDLDEAKDDFAVAEDDHKPDGKSAMNLPFDSMSYVNDKVVKMTSGQRITIAVGDIAKEKVLRSIVKNCVTKSESQNFHSIAFPAIGTGNLKFPRSEVVKIFFEEVTSYFTVNPQSKVNNVRFVAYGGDKETVDAFLGAVEEMKPILSATKRNIPSHDLGFPGQSQSAFVQSFTPSSATTSENPDGSLEVKFPKQTPRVEIVCADISQETTQLIMHVTNENFSLQGGVAKALVKAGGDKIEEECKALGTAPLFSTQYTGAGKLLVNQIAHVIGPGKPSYQDLKKCLDNFSMICQEKALQMYPFLPSVPVQWVSRKGNL